MTGLSVTLCTVSISVGVPERVSMRIWYSPSRNKRHCGGVPSHGLSESISLSFTASVGCQHALSKLSVRGRVPFASVAWPVKSPVPSALNVEKSGDDQPAFAIAGKSKRAKAERFIPFSCCGNFNQCATRRMCRTHPQTRSFRWRGKDE
ncbi:hypothetical protein D3C78_1144170 [compost metagenome]